MNKFFRNAVFFIFVSLCPPPFATAMEVVVNSDDQLGFARQYMEKEEYQKAIIELDRLLYFFPDDENAPMARYMTGICYLKMRDYEPAQEIFGDLSIDHSGTPLGEKSLFLIGESYYEQGLTQEAENYFRQVIEDYKGSELGDTAFYRLGWNNLKAGNWQKASESFKRVGKGSRFYADSMDLAQRSLRGGDLPYKNPAAAGVMAGFLPGLGHAYCGRYRDSAVAFMVNGLFIWAAAESFGNDNEVLGGILTFFEAGWYAGNIYSAVNCAHKYNRKIRNDFIGGLADRLSIDLFADGRRHLGIALSINF